MESKKTAAPNKREKARADCDRYSVALRQALPNNLTGQADALFHVVRSMALLGLERGFARKRVKQAAAAWCYRGIEHRLDFKDAHAVFLKAWDAAVAEWQA